MFRKFLRLFYTLRYIKRVQWQYQLWYRVKNRFISIHWYKNYLQQNFIPLEVNLASVLYAKQNEYLGSNVFEFIGLKQSFKDSIDWNYQGHGKLWNYNLQYFTYLLDETISSEERLRLLKDFSHRLLSSNIQPEPYPVSLRVINTLLFHSRYPITDAIVLEALQKQIDYLDHNLEYHLLANHLLENAFSLFIASFYLENTSLYNKSYRLLIAQLDEQILSDGGHYECSVMYQSILLSKLLLCIDIARKSTLCNTITLTFLEERAAKMLGWMNAYSFPDGTWALMNDAAEKIAPTTTSLNEAAAILNIKPADIILKDSGFRKIKGYNWELLIKTGGVQPFYQPGHVHADITSFCLWHKGKQVIVDPGISTYAISRQRLEQRGTASHNTISINERNQSDVWSGFRIGKRAKFALLKDHSQHVEVSVVPYYNRKVNHIRLFRKNNEQQLEIEDQIICDNKMQTSVCGTLQFSNVDAPQLIENNIHLKHLMIHMEGIQNAALVPSSYATQYHHLMQALCLKYSVVGQSKFIFQFS